MEQLAQGFTKKLFKNKCVSKLSSCSLELAFNLQCILAKTFLYNNCQYQKRNLILKKSFSFYDEQLCTGERYLLIGILLLPLLKGRGHVLTTLPIYKQVKIDLFRQILITQDVPKITSKKGVGQTILYVSLKYTPY